MDRLDLDPTDLNTDDRRPIHRARHRPLAMRALEQRLSQRRTHRIDRPCFRLHRDLRRRNALMTRRPIERLRTGNGNADDLILHGLPGGIPDTHRSSYPVSQVESLWSSRRVTGTCMPISITADPLIAVLSMRPLNRFTGFADTPAARLS